MDILHKLISQLLYILCYVPKREKGVDIRLFLCYNNQR